MDGGEVIARLLGADSVVLHLRLTLQEAEQRDTEIAGEGLVDRFQRGQAAAGDLLRTSKVVGLDAVLTALTGGVEQRVDLVIRDQAAFDGVFVLGHGVLLDHEAGEIQVFGDGGAGHLGQDLLHFLETLLAQFFLAVAGHELVVVTAVQHLQQVVADDR